MLLKSFPALGYIFYIWTVSSIVGDVCISNPICCGEIRSEDVLTSLFVSVYY